MSKIKIVLIIVILCIVIAGTSCGAAYASWIYSGSVNSSGNSVSLTVQDWDFTADSDFAMIGNVDRDNLAYLDASQETSIVCGSAEAVRLTNTAGTQTKEHSVIFRFDRTYTVGEIKIQKISFDYYHEQRREQVGIGFPRLQLVKGTSGVGNVQPLKERDNVCDEISCFSVTELANGWWHLEYFITAFVPTFADHGDSGISETKEVDGIKIIDRYIYNHNSITAYCVVDNLQISAQASIKLGLFNKGTEIKVGNYYWMKVAWAGTVHNVTITFSDAGSDDPIAVYTPSNKSPFYIKTLKVGTVVATCTMELGDEHQILSISNTLTVY